MATQNAYGTFNPAALEPYPIETELAKQSFAGDTAQSQTALDQYWLERQANKNLYGQELDAQHEAARQQIVAQLADARAKGIAGLAGHPGGYDIAASMGFIDPSDAHVQAAMGAANAAQGATNLEHAGSGAYNMVQAGNTPDPQTLTNMTGVPLTPGTPLAIQTANINAAARLAAARIRAAGDANAAPGSSATLPPNPELGGISESLHKPKGWSDDQWNAYLKTRVPGSIGAAPPPVPPSMSGSGGRSAGTNLPPAKTETMPAPGAQPPAQQPAAASAPGNAAVLKTVRDWVETNKARMSPAQYADITGAYAQNGGNPVIAQGPDGKPVIIGKSKKQYR
jgi:hypothetical protein